jgi:antitoxin HigA-1
MTEWIRKSDAIKVLASYKRGASFPDCGDDCVMLDALTENHIRELQALPSTTVPEGLADRLHNSHAGELLASEFMDTLGLTAEALAVPLGVKVSRLSDVIDGKRPVDAELDLRLTRYFRMSEGFFLRLQLDHDLLEAKRALNGELEGE